jgi:hypothetical protein
MASSYSDDMTTLSKNFKGSTTVVESPGRNLKAFIEMMEYRGGGIIMGVLNTDTGKMQSPTTIKHYQVSHSTTSTLMQFSKCEAGLHLIMTMFAYSLHGDKHEMFKGAGTVEKPGLIIFLDNKYQTGIRCWSSYVVKNRLIYEISIATYEPAT